jgi:hypothetical protein
MKNGEVIVMMLASAWVGSMWTIVGLALAGGLR